MKIAITGMKGMIGSYLKKYFSDIGHEVKGISREQIKDKEILCSCLEKVDVVINLAGANIGKRRWSKRQKNLMYDSRIETTKTLVNAMNKLCDPPEILISASACGYYGIDACSNIGEGDNPGEDFLARLCVDWEKQANHYKRGRVINARFGVVLSKDGGMLSKLIRLAEMRLLSVIGDGSQNLSFIAIDDLASIFKVFIENKNTNGPFNICNQEPITNREMSTLIAKKVNKKLFFPIPQFVVKLAFGQMGESLLLANQLIKPKKLIELNYPYKYENFIDYILKLKTTTD